MRTRIDSTAKAGAATVALSAQFRPAAGGGGRGGLRGHDDYNGLTPAFVKPAAIAWYASHKHEADGVNLYSDYSYLYAYSIEIPAGAATLTLPNDDAIRILAITVVNEPVGVVPASPLHVEFAAPTPEWSERVR